MSNKNWTLVAAVLGSGVVFLDTAVLPVALAAIGRELRLFLDIFEAQNYIHYGYLLSLSALLVLAGAISDRYGRRRTFAIGLIGFGLTSLLCGLAPNLELLVLFRLLQGAAGAMLVPGSLALLTQTFHGEEQGRAYGIWAAMSGAATIIGPFVGGLLVEIVGWRAIFLINVPLIAVALWAVRRHVAESRGEVAAGRLDWIGALLVALAVGGLSFGTIYGQQRGWADALAIGALVVGTVATVAVPLWLRRAARPLVPLSMFRSRNFSVTNLSTTLIYGSLYVLFFLLALYLVGTLGYTAAAAGLGTVPGALFLMLLSPRFGALAVRHGPRRFMVVGPVLMAAGMAWLARIPTDSPAWRLTLADPATWLPTSGYLVDVLPAMTIHGLGVAIMVAPLTTALMRSVPAAQAGLASAINNAVSRVGPQLAGALVFVVVTAAFYGALAARAPSLDLAAPGVRDAIAPLREPPASLTADQAQAARESSTDAFHLAMTVTALLAASGALVNGLGISDRQARDGPTTQGAADELAEIAALRG